MVMMTGVTYQRKEEEEEAEAERNTCRTSVASRPSRFFPGVIEIVHSLRCLSSTFVAIYFEMPSGIHRACMCGTARTRSDLVIGSNGILRS